MEGYIVYSDEDKEIKMDSEIYPTLQQARDAAQEFFEENQDYTELHLLRVRPARKLEVTREVEIEETVVAAICRC